MNELLKEARDRVAKYLDERSKMRGIDKEHIHGLHGGDEREAILLASDLLALTAALSSVEAKPVAIPVMPEMALAEDFCAPRDWDEDQRRDWAQLQAAATNEGRLRKHALELHALLAAPLASVEAPPQPLTRLWPVIEKAMGGLVFTADKAGEVAADMQAVRDWIAAPAEGSANV